MRQRFAQFIGALLVLLVPASALLGADTPANAPAPALAAYTLDNGSLTATAQPGAGVLILTSGAGGKPTRLELLLCGADGATAPLQKVERKDSVLRIGAAGIEADVALGEGQPVVTVTPAQPGGSLEVRVESRYAVMPDFFADDAVFDPLKFSSSSLTIPAENFLLHLAGDGRAIVLCAWPGHQAGGESPGKSGPEAAPDDDPRVVLQLEGAGANRRIRGSAIEFLGKPVHVGVLEHDNIWHDAAITSWPGYRAGRLDWKPPFKAAWRADFIVAEGKTMTNWRTRQQSFDFMKADKDGKAPEIWQESLKDKFRYPAYLSGPDAFLCPYVDKAVRRKTGGTDKSARESDKTGPEPPVEHAYERALIYPLDRAKETPLAVWTPVDFMRSTLGKGPCEYVLDLEGLKPRSSGHDRPLLAGNTCGLWDGHIQPIVEQIAKLKTGQKLEAATRDHLARALEDTKVFVVVVADRIREYKAWATDVETFSQREAARTPAVNPLTRKVLARLAEFRAEMDEVRFEGDGTEGYWKTRIDEWIAEVNRDDYSHSGQMGNVRTLGGYQDGKVSRCRQYVKAVRQEVTLADAADPDARKYGAEIRDRCRRILRNKHRKEGL